MPSNNGGSRVRVFALMMSTLLLLPALVMAEGEVLLGEVPLAVRDAASVEGQAGETAASSSRVEPVRTAASYAAPFTVEESPAVPLSSYAFGSCAVDGICNTYCPDPALGLPYDWDCAAWACAEPNVCGTTGGTCPPDEYCVGNVCVCFFGEA